MLIGVPHHQIDKTYLKFKNAFNTKSSVSRVQYMLVDIPSFNKVRNDNFFNDDLYNAPSLDIMSLLSEVIL